MFLASPYQLFGAPDEEEQPWGKWMGQAMSAAIPPMPEKPIRTGYISGGDYAQTPTPPERLRLESILHPNGRKEMFGESEKVMDLLPDEGWSAAPMLPLRRPMMTTQPSNGLSVSGFIPAQGESLPAQLMPSQPEYFPLGGGSIFPIRAAASTGPKINNPSGEYFSGDYAPGMQPLTAMQRLMMIDPDSLMDTSVLGTTSGLSPMLNPFGVRTTSQASRIASPEAAFARMLLPAAIEESRQQGFAERNALELAKAQLFAQSEQNRVDAVAGERAKRDDEADFNKKLAFASDPKVPTAMALAGIDRMEQEGLIKKPEADQLRLERVLRDPGTGAPLGIGKAGDLAVLSLIPEVVDPAAARSFLTGARGIRREQVVQRLQELYDKAYGGTTGKMAGPAKTYDENRLTQVEKDEMARILRFFGRE